MEQCMCDLIRNEFKALVRHYQGRIDDVPISELGIDSLDFFEFIYRMDEVHGIRLHNIVLDNKLTLNGLIDGLTS